MRVSEAWRRRGEGGVEECEACAVLPARVEYGFTLFHPCVEVGVYFVCGTYAGCYGKRGWPEAGVAEARPMASR